jgi:hypothetical protein
VNTPFTGQSHAYKPRARQARTGALRHLLVAGCMIASLFLSLLPLKGAHASGVFWLPTQQASDASFDHLNPVLASYKNHAYALSVQANDALATTSVFFSTNESGKWTTQLMVAQGPVDTYSREFISLAVDAGTGRLYATWVYQKTVDADALGVWMRDPSGQWSGPVDAVTAGSLVGQPFIVAGNGKAYAAFISSETPGPCDDSKTTAGDVQIVVYDGATWSAPQNVTSCVNDASILEFATPKLALDEAGHLHLIAAANNDLWYSDTLAGSWSVPTQITHGANIPESVGTALRTFYGIAASNGVAYVTYVHHVDTTTDDVMLTSRSTGGSWSTAARASPADSQDCPKFGLSIVANAGLLGISYVRGSSGYCHGTGGTNGNVPYLFTGAPGQLAAVGSLEAANPNCFATFLAHEGNLLRFVTTCDAPANLGKGQLSYKAEFLDTVGPKAHLSVSGHASTTIHLAWSATDPQPGSGVAAFELQGRAKGEAWRTLLASTATRSLTYHAAVRTSRYAFRLRAKDHVDNWGAWATASAAAR